MSEVQQKVRYRIDTNTWSWRVWLLASSGLLAGSYNLFAVNAVLPAIAFIYFPDGTGYGRLINAFTLLGALVGQLLFGILGDRLGRLNAYRISLSLVIVSTLYTIESGTGLGNLSFIPLFTSWRFFAGISNGALYPLCAVVASEWTSSSWRAPFVSAVFLMHALGPVLVQLVGLSLLLGWSEYRKLQLLNCGLDSTSIDECGQILNAFWRVVVGAGLLPAVFSIALSIFVPESGLYQLEVKGSPITALKNIDRVYGKLRTSLRNGLQSSDFPDAKQVRTNAHPTSPGRVFGFFNRDRNWLLLLGVCMMSFLVEVAFTWFGLDSGHLLANIWSTTPPVQITASMCGVSPSGGSSSVPGWSNGLPLWQTDVSKPCRNIYDVLIELPKQYIATVSVGSILGGICFIAVVNRVHRRRFATTSFLVTSLVFLVTGVVYCAVHHSPAHFAAVVMLRLSHFVLYIGPSSLLFLVPSEIFPSRYRCSCYGASAAAGKLGAITALLIIRNNAGNTWPNAQLILSILAGGLGAVFSFLFIPDI